MHLKVGRFSYRYVKCTARWEDTVTEMLSAPRGGKIQIQKCKVDFRVGRYGEVGVYRYRNVECTARMEDAGNPISLHYRGAIANGKLPGTADAN